MRPAHALALEEHNFAFEAELGYQNTWALSPEVERYLTSIESEGRRHIGPEEIQAIRDLPGESYLLDVESAVLDRLPGGHRLGAEDRIVEETGRRAQTRLPSVRRVMVSAIISRVMVVSLATIMDVALNSAIHAMHWSAGNAPV